MWRCKGGLDPSEVSSLGKLSVLSKPYNLISRNAIQRDFSHADKEHRLLFFLELRYDEFDEHTMLAMLFGYEISR